MGNWVQIPGYREAVECEQTARDQAFLDAPIFLAGVEVEPFTLKRMALLDAIRSPFLYGASARALAFDCGMFLWLVSTEYTRAMRVRARISRVSERLARLWIRWRIFRLMLKVRRAQDPRAEIAAYVERALYDAPKGAAGASGTAYWGVMANTVGVIAAAFGWTEDSILSMRCERVWQYYKVAKTILNPSTIHFNPSDKLKSKFLREEMARQAAARN